MMDGSQGVLVTEPGLASDAGASAAAPDEHDVVRALVRAAMGEDGVPMTRVAEQAGIPYGTFSSFMGRTYEGRNDKVAHKARVWLDARAARSQSRAKMPAALGFVRTPTAADFWNVLTHAQHAPDFVCIAGGAGIGKTTTAREYQRASPNVWVMTAEPVMSSPYSMLAELAELLGLSERAPDRRSRAILQRVRNTGGLLVIDEAQHLKSPALDQLRSIHDLAEIGVALIGNEAVYSRLEGEGRRPQFAQLFSRIGMRLTRARPTLGDIDTLLDGWGVGSDAETGGARTMLRQIARKPGALRGMTKVLRLAHVGAGEARETLGAEHVRRAWSSLGDGQAVGESD